MSAPCTADEYLHLVRRSGTVDENRLDLYVRQLQAAGGPAPAPGRLASLLVRDGLLTRFQAEQCLKGRWKRFTLGKYRILERLGSGGMAQVFLGEHVHMRRRVALKVLPPSKAETPSLLERFYREARAVAALDHPNIVRAYDIDQEDDLHFLVMEYVDGSSLHEVVAKGGPMEVFRACHYIAQAAEGLQHAHEHGLIHRDIKPSNLLLGRQGLLKVLDLGLARFFHDTDDLTREYSQAGVLGTADYLAPEQALDSHNVDTRADIYSLGCTFSFLLTGNAPFGEGSASQKLIWHQMCQPPSVRRARPDVPVALAAVLDRMLAKAPRQRYQTPRAVAEALTPWTQTPIAPPPRAEMPHWCQAALGPGPAAYAPATRTPTPGSRATIPLPPLLTAGARRPAGTAADTTPLPRPADASPDWAALAAPKARPVDRRRPRPWWGLAALVLAGVAAGTWLIAFPGRPATPPPEQSAARASLSPAPDAPRPEATVPKLAPSRRRRGRPRRRSESGA